MQGRAKCQGLVVFRSFVSRFCKMADRKQSRRGPYAKQNGNIEKKKSTESRKSRKFVRDYLSDQRRQNYHSSSYHHGELKIASTDINTASACFDLPNGLISLEGKSPSASRSYHKGAMDQSSSALNHGRGDSSDHSLQDLPYSADESFIDASDEFITEIALEEHAHSINPTTHLPLKEETLFDLLHCETVNRTENAETESDYEYEDAREYVCSIDGLNSDEDNVPATEHLFGCEIDIGDYVVKDAEENESTEDESCIEDKPIHSKSLLTVSAAMVLILSFAVKHSLSADALSHLFLLLQILLPPGTGICKTIYKFKKYFSNIKSPIIYHGFCADCFYPVDKSHHSDETCPNKACQKHIDSEPAVIAYFIEFPIIQQLRSFFKREKFYDSLSYRFNRKKKTPQALEDIYDGELYKEFVVNNDILSSQNNISFTFNTDGAAVFKSSNYSVWPIYLVINELEPKQRFLDQNMIFAGLWHGKHKPYMWLYLKPTFEALLKLEEGIDFNVNRSNYVSETIKVRCLLLCSTCDLPARCLLCGSMQYNGRYGCWKCLQPGKTSSTGKKGGGVWTYPFNEDDPSGPPRTHRQVLDDSAEARTTKKPVNGIKHPTWFHHLQFHDLVRSVGIDYMHGVLLGVTKLLLRLWFSKEFSRCSFSAYHLLPIVDKRIMQIKPTIDISRVPRTIGADLKHWKASEFRTFLLYYGVPILTDILPTEQLQHFTLLSHAIFILTSDSILPEEIARAETMLVNFVRNFQKLYGVRFMFYNVHQLLHLAADVRILGPLWTHSCFAFEDKNRFLLRLIHGTQKIEFQIISAVNLVQKLPELANNAFSLDPLANTLYNLLTARKIMSKTGWQISDKIFMLGSMFSFKLDDLNVYNAICSTIGHILSTTNMNGFHRIRIGAEVIHAETYAKVTKRDSFTVSFTDSKEKTAYGKIKQFIQCVVNDNECWYFAIIKQYRVLVEQHDSHFTIVSKLQNNVDNIVAVPLDNIREKLFVTDFDNSTATLLAKFPNLIEGD